jgi:hypothetical protein
MNKQRVVLYTHKNSLGNNINMISSDVDPDPFVLGAPWIRIRHYFVQIRILSSTSKKSKKNLGFYDFVT